jgi:hypothetical protein
VASRSRYSRPSDIKQPTVGWSVTSGAANASFPVANLGDKRPDKPFKATGTSVTVRATFSLSTVLTGIAIFNHNLEGASVTLTSATGLSIALTIPSNTGGQSNPIIRDFTASTLSQRDSTQFNLVITGGLLGNVAIGEVLLIGDGGWRELDWSWGLTWKPRRLVRTHMTFGASQLQYNKRIRIREGRGLVKRQTSEAAMRVLEEETQGEVHPWLVVATPDTAPPEGYYVKFAPGSFEWRPTSPGSTEIPIHVVELSNGPPLFV